MKQRVNDHHIWMEAIDSWRQNKIVQGTAKCCVPPTQKSVQEHPNEELRQMRPWNARDFMPEDGARIGRMRRSSIAKVKVFDVLRIKVYLAAVIPGEPLEQFCKRALRAMAAIDKRRNDREPQVSASIGAQVGLRER
jgi:hypothetical protein